MEDANLTLVSYNISFGEPSFSAPNRSLRSQEAPRLIREECLRNDPDIICLQECPTSSWAQTVFEPDYISLGTQVASHVNGFIDLLVRRELATNDTRRIKLEHPALPLPSVAAIITLSNNTRVAVCSIHLPHTAEGATNRALMCETIMQIVSQQCNNCTLMGDFNMREKEDKAIENLVGGGWLDVWKKTRGVKDKESKYTWDSRTNLFHDDGYQFIARFDRCYARGNDFSLNQFDLIGNQSVSGAEGDYLSDHFGIQVKIGVKASPTVANGNAKVGVRQKANGQKKNDMDMVDLTGDSDDEEDDVKATISGGNSNKHGSTNTANCTQSLDMDGMNASMGNGKPNDSEIRRLRLQKFMGEQTSANIDKKEPSMGLSSKMNPNQNECSYIEPMQPTKFNISHIPKRYIIYMAIREEKGSNFERALAQCKEVCHDGIKHCLQMDGTRHITMFDGNLTSSQVEALSFSGQFDPVDIKLQGWCPWDAGGYLKLCAESERALKDLLNRINGLPSFGGKRPCDHLSLYRRRANTKHPNPKSEFARIREATRNVDFGSVQGVSIRIKAFGCPYDECLVLAESSQSRSNDANESNQPRKSNPEQSPPEKERWNDGLNSDDDQKSKAKEEEIKSQTATFRDHSASTNTSIPLSIVSWNLSETSGSVSAAAPDHSLRRKESARLIREECFRPHFMSQKDNDKTYLPDIIALQETPAAGGRANFSAMLRETLAANGGGENGAAKDLDFSALFAGGASANSDLPALLSARLQEIAAPRDNNNEPSWGDKVFGRYGYVSVGTQSSHCGLVDLLVRKDFAPQRVLLDDNLPSVAAILTLPNKTNLAIASNHLAPSGDGASEREDECRSLMTKLSSICDNVILIGDFNMRGKEDKKIEGLVGGGWLDAWKEGSGSNKKLKFTWDSFTNLYHENDFGFTCRFDRCYARGDSINISNFDLMGNVPVHAEGDYLSDHFGLIVEITANPSAEKNAKAVASRKREGLVNDANVEFFQFEEGSMSKLNKPKSDLPQLEDAANKRSCADHNKHAHKHQNQRCDGWGSDEDVIMGSEETIHRANGNRAMPTKTDTTTSKTTTMKPHTSTETSTNSDSLDSCRGGSKKEQKKKEKAKVKKKRNRFESSSSSDDEGFEDMKRKLREKQGKPSKKRLLPHLPNSSSDEDF